MSEGGPHVLAVADDGPAVVGAQGGGQVQTETVWARRALPAPRPGARVLGLWQPATPADVTAHRRQLSAALHDGARPPGAAEDAVEALALVWATLGHAGSRPAVAAIPVRRFAAASRTAVPDRSRWRASWSAGEPTSGVTEAEA